MERNPYILVPGAERAPVRQPAGSDTGSRTACGSTMLADRQSAGHVVLKVVY